MGALWRALPSLANRATHHDGELPEARRDAAARPASPAASGAGLHFGTAGTARQSAVRRRHAGVQLEQRCLAGSAESRVRAQDWRL